MYIEFLDLVVQSYNSTINSGVIYKSNSWTLIYMYIHLICVLLSYIVFKRSKVHVFLLIVSHFTNLLLSFCFRQIIPPECISHYIIFMKIERHLLTLGLHTCSFIGMKNTFGLKLLSSVASIQWIVFAVM